ncbi:MAG TPA: response regulator [Gaiellaceae bacterium]|nr:response regulator [Gaiellaceae bacterium]
MAAGGGTVLVVDDDESLRMLCRINLELDGFDVVEAGSIADARRVLEHGGVDAMLLDLHLGDGDGRDLLASLGPERPPVALFTGSEKIGPDLERAAEAVLPKPFGIELLAETVRRLIAGAGR